MVEIFHVATPEEIKKGKVTDVYFTRVVRTLEHLGKNPYVSAEIRASSFPEGWKWAVFSGLEESLKLMEGLDADIYAMPEGSVFFPEDTVMIIEGRYLNFAIYETSLLGFLCQASGIATKAARCRVAAGDRLLVSFGARRMHPAISPMIERNAFIGGCNGVSALASAELIHEKPLGTMSHSLMLVVGDDKEAFVAFDQVVEPEVNRIALIDTYHDEKFGAIRAVEALGDRLFAVRLDTPSSRRGDFLKIIQEVRWELDIRGFGGVKIFLSGGLDEHAILKYNRYADAYGVGTSISNAPVIDFSFDIVEVEGELRAKRGKMGGKKQTHHCTNCKSSQLTLFDRRPEPCSCGELPRPMLKKCLEKGRLVEPLPSPQEVRSYVLEQLEEYRLGTEDLE